jgi:hypothetical protein
MERRNFIKFVSTGIVATPMLTVSSLAKATKSDKPLPPVVPYQTLTAETMNQLIQRVNDISDRVL